MSEKTLGIIGGVGPLSTAYFLEVLVNMTDAQTDQEHIDAIILNHCSIPDRTDYILDNSKPDPAAVMAADAKRLEGLGCDVIVTPCNTAHYFYDKLAKAVSVPFINMIEATAVELKKKRAKKVGIMATSGTIAAGMFQTELEKLGIEAVVPSQENQQYVMDIIYYDIKANHPLETDKFKSVVDEMRINGCDYIILGCTELSVLKKEYSLNEYYVDALEVLCERAIIACGKKVKQK